MVRIAVMAVRQTHPIWQKGVEDIMDAGLVFRDIGDEAFVIFRQTMEAGLDPRSAEQRAALPLFLLAGGCFRIPTGRKVIFHAAGTAKSA